MNRAASAMLVAFSGFNGSSPFKQSQSDGNAAAKVSSVGRTGRPASAAPHTSSPVQKWQPSRAVPPTAESESLPWTKLGIEKQQQRQRSVASRSERAQENGGRDNDVQDKQECRVVEETIVEMQDAPMSEVAGGKISSIAFQDFIAKPKPVPTSSSSAPVRHPSPFEQVDSDDVDPFTTTGAEARRPRKETQQLPSPPRSHASVVSEPAARRQHDVTAPLSSFKKPSLPASAVPSTFRQPIAAGARHVRAGTTDSRASSFTLPASPGSQRGASVKSRTSITSRQTGATQTRKRQMMNKLSSDEDSDSQSDYAPSKNASPIDGESPKPTKHVHTAKKTKTNDGAEIPIKAKPRVQKVMGRNGYGFKFAPTLGKTVSGGSKPAARPPIEPRRTVTPKTVKKTLALQFTKRRAAIAANDKIQNILDSTSEFETELAIEEADHIESARLPEGLRRMSLTPSPPDENSVDALTEPGSFRG